ncbi:unnamed protein product [Prorocentrum cordatum]|uniref:50S ribosomal protein L22, chloroplastic n=1 Tax=Prorocentrum cordatum TaxID=2364126 RepID=A0ABN9W304_9DINO|nr:unnamed protein product [Polarella glacialis]
MRPPMPLVEEGGAARGAEARPAGIGRTMLRARAALRRRLCGSPLCRAAVVAAPPWLHPCAGSARGFFWPRKNWLPWRVRLIDDRKKAMLRKRHVLPRTIDPEEAPIFYPKEDGSQLAFRDKDIRLNMKKMLEYCKLIRGRQLTDAIDWVESLSRMQSEPILKTLKRAVEECRERHKWDIARTYIFDAQPQRGPFVKNLRKGSKASFGILNRPRNYFMVRVRQMPLEEFFHRVYVFNKVPRSMASDMRLALTQGRVGPQAIKEWAPYLCGRSRFWHRKELKWRHSTRQWDYYQARREWIQQYKANLLRASTEAREARGLPPLSMLEQ